MSKIFLSIKGLCERYDIKRTTCHEWRKRDNFPNSITPQNCNPRWRIKDIEQWETNNFG
jgi:predicted DNA-binding transcriptional regulator AlpA